MPTPSGATPQDAVCTKQNCDTPRSPEGLCPICQPTQLMDLRHRNELAAGIHPEPCQGTYRNGNPCRHHAYADHHCRQHWSTPEIDARISEATHQARDLADDATDHAPPPRTRNITHRGFRIRNQSPGQDQQWHVTALTPQAAQAHAQSTGIPWYGGLPLDCGSLQHPRDEVIARINNLLDDAQPLDSPDA